MMDQYTYDSLTPDDKVAALQDLAERAEKATDIGRCVRGEAVFLAYDTQARLPGHIYSAEGEKEFHISSACEYHFDKWFKPHEEEDTD